MNMHMASIYPDTPNRYQLTHLTTLNSGYDYDVLQFYFSKRNGIN